MILSTFLRVMLDTTAPNLGELHVFKNVLVDFVAEGSDGGILPFDHHRFALVRHFPPGFGLDADQVQAVPNHFLQAVQVPLELGRDRTHILGLAQQVQLL